MCERAKEDRPMDAEQVEDIVKTAISYSDGDGGRAYRSKSKWKWLYIFSLLIGGAGIFLNFRLGRMSQMLFTAVPLGAVFGAYFCFFVKMRLPDYYDEHRISGIHDGILRMNVPGLTFNNSNWPYIVLVGRIWSCLAMVLFPAIEALMTFLRPEWWYVAELCVFPVLLLGGLFIPLYVVGKKYE